MKRVYLGVIFIVLALFAIGCSDKEDVKQENKNGQGKVADQTFEPVVVKHELGETTINSLPETVVVFDFGSLDTLDKLGVEGITGVPKQNIPSYLSKYEADQYEHVGGLKEPDFEKIAEINPDLIIISDRQAELYEQFTELANTIYLGVDMSDYMASFKSNVTTLGQIFGKEAEAKAALDDIDSSVSTLKEKAEQTNKNALIILSNEDQISAYGVSSRFGMIHDEFGIPPVDEKIEVSTHGSKVSFEYLTKMDPDILYVIDRNAVVGGEANAKKVVENALTEKTKAYQNDDIYYLNPDIWYLSGGGLISVQEMVNEIDASIK